MQYRSLDFAELPSPKTLDHFQELLDRRAYKPFGTIFSRHT